jgi:monoamine oxidase
MQAHFGEKIIILALFSQASIIQEMYDHSTADYKGYALKVLNGGTHTLSEEERKRK